MYKIELKSCVLLMAAMMMVTSCKKDLPEGIENIVVGKGGEAESTDLEVTPELSLDTSNLTFTAESGNRSFSVKSNTSWSVSSDKSWCSVSPTSGKNDGDVLVVVQANNSTEERTATVTVKAGSITRTLAVSQKGKEASSPSSQNRTFTVGSVTFKMIWVEGGTFTMGATSSQGTDYDEDERPTHSVTLSSYSIGETEVTQALWKAVMGSNPAYFIGNQRPVECVSWYDCQSFIRQLNSLTGENFRLPTEAEWEFAARGGNKSLGYKYAGSNSIGSVAWYYDNCYIKGEYSSDYGTHNVGTKLANELGLYDMSGNVREWCNDWYSSYSSSSQRNPTGPSTGSDRVFRGGGWSIAARGCRCTYRSYYEPTHGSDSYAIGFRLAL